MTGDAASNPGRTLWSDAWRRLLRNRAAAAAALLLGLIVLACLLGPALLPFAPDEIFWEAIQAPPDFEAGHYFGTDANGRDLLARMLQGGRVSLAVGLAATLVSLVIGVAYGAVAGYAGGRADELMMRVVDILYSLPFMFFVILLMVFFGRNILLIFVAIGAVEWLDMARIVRGQTISLKRREFVEAARALGAGGFAILRRHVIPNTLGPVIVYATLTVPKVILLESFLSFLGLGVQEPMTSWGVLISEGAPTMEFAPWLLVFPAAFLAATLFCLNFIGDGLRDALDPRDSRW
jgi:oligopeptide transport system permease protein